MKKIFRALVIVLALFAGQAWAQNKTEVLWLGPHGDTAGIYQGTGQNDHQSISNLPGRKDRILN